MKKTKSIFPLGKRIAQVFLQLLLLPLSAIVSVFGAWVVWFTLFHVILAIITGDTTALVLVPFAGAFANLITWMIAVLVLHLIESITKRTFIEEDYSTEGHTYTYQEKVSHDIYNRSGVVIGSYDTTETKTGTTGSLGVLKYLVFYVRFFLCRIITFIASILACFTNNFYVSARVPNESRKYNRFLYEYFDIVVIEDEKEENAAVGTPILSTILVLLPIAILTLGAFLMINNPLFVFEHVSLGVVLAIYIVAILFYVVAAIAIKYTIHKVVFGFGAALILFSIMIGIGGLNTITISNVSDFEAIVHVPQASKRNYELVADLDFEGKSSAVWGLFDDFTGTFDGNNHTISNLTITTESRQLNCGEIYVSESKKSKESTDVKGFGFVQINNGLIENVRFDQIDIVVQPSQNFYHFVGVVAAYNSGTINNCLVTNCTIQVAEGNERICYVGGIVGYDDSGEISNVAFINTEDDVVFDVNSEKYYLGGIAGESYAANMTNVYTYQNNKELDRCGGIIGVAEALSGYSDVPAYLTNCVNCFDESIIAAYGEEVKPLVKKENVLTLDNTPINNSADLPKAITNWTYFSEFNCYVPCTGFDGVN